MKLAELISPKKIATIKEEKNIGPLPIGAIDPVYPPKTELGKTYLIVEIGYEDAKFFQLDKMSDFNKLKQYAERYGDYVGLFKCVKK